MKETALAVAPSKTWIHQLQKLQDSIAEERSEVAGLLPDVLDMIRGLLVSESPKDRKEGFDAWEKLHSKGFNQATESYRLGTEAQKMFLDHAEKMSGAGDGQSVEDLRLANYD